MVIKNKKDFIFYNHAKIVYYSYYITQKELRIYPPKLSQQFFMWLVLV